MDISSVDFQTIRSLLTSGQVSCVELIEQYLNQIESKQHLNAFISVFAEKALTRAKQIDERLHNGNAGPLAGMVLGIKDNIAIKGEKLTCGSAILAKFSSPYNATVIKKLTNADAIFIGKTNMDEFAMGSSNETSFFGPVLNPKSETHVPGGSSGGSAAAVAAGFCCAALGSDTGGSIRQPAAFCGVVGMKPTYGRVSRFGLVAFASSLDQIGPVARTIADTAVLLEAISGYDSYDSTSANISVPQFSRNLNLNRSKIRIGVPQEFLGDGLDEKVREAVFNAVELIKSSEVEVNDVSLPHSDYAIATYYTLADAEASSNLARYDGALYGYRAPNPTDLDDMYVKSRSAGFGLEVKRRIMLGTYVLSAGYYEAYYRKAQKVRNLIKADFENAFNDFDCLIAPTSPTTAFKLGDKLDDPMSMYLSDIYTVSANLAGLPALSMSCGNDSHGLPIGIQIIGQPFDEQTILQVAHLLEQTLDEHPYGQKR